MNKEKKQVKFYRLHRPISVIGRAVEATIITQNLDISKRHLVIMYDQATKTFLIQDIASKYGTYKFFNNMIHELKENDEFMIG